MYLGTLVTGLRETLFVGIPPEIVREVIPDTLKTILLKIFQEKSSDVDFAQFSDILSIKRWFRESEAELGFLLYFNPEGKNL